MRPKNKACLLLSIAVFGLTGAASSWAVSDDAQQSLEILVEQMQGRVDVSTDGDSRRVAIGTALDLPSRIVTGEDGRITLRQARTGVEIAPESDVEIPEAARDGQLIARMVQHSGSAFYDVETRPLEQLKLTVETPYLVAVVKGTQFNVTVVNNTTTISLFEGVLEIRSPDGQQSIELNAGEIAIRSLADDTIRLIPMDADRLDDAARVDVRGGADVAAGSAARVAGPATVTGEVVVAGANGESGTPGIASADAAVELAAPGIDAAKLTAGAEIGEVLAVNVDSIVRIDTVADVNLGLGANVSTNVDLGGGSVDLGLDAGLDTGIDLGGGSVDLGLDAGLDTGLDLGGGSVDLGLDAGLDTGIDLGGGSVDLGLDAGLDTGIDLGGAVLDTGLDLGLDAGLDAGLDTGLDLGADAGLDTGLGLDVDLGLDLGVDADSGLDLGLDLGVGGTGGSGSSDGSGSSGGGGGLLGGLGGLL